MKTDRKIVTYEQLAKISQRIKQKQESLVLTTGCYDILHLGHVIHFNYCKTQGDFLVVSVGNDQTVRNLKGPTRPINNELFRARMVATLVYVDYVVISTELGKMDHTELVALIKPDIYVVPGTDSMLEQKKELIENNGGKFITCHRLPPNKLKGGISTTKLAKELKLE